MGDFLPDWAEQAFGAVLLLIVLLDVFLTVLYARAGSGIISHVIARATWLLFKGLSKLSHRYRGSIHFNQYS